MSIINSINLKNSLEHFTQSPLYCKYQEYLYNCDFYLKNDNFAPITTRLVFESMDIWHPWNCPNDIRKPTYACFVIDAIQFGKLPIMAFNSSYKADIADWFATGNEPLSWTLTWI